MGIHQELKSIDHHAYLLIGAGVVNTLKAFLEKIHGIKTVANPDFISRSYETFSIDDARELKAIHGMKPVHSSAKKIFIISIGGITVEAENALLKLLEEPAPYAHFFLVAPSAHLFLPTVKSRLAIIDCGSEKRISRSPEAVKFLNSSRAKRLDMVKIMLADVTKEKRSKSEIVNFLHDLELVVYEDKGVRGGRRMLEAIALIRKYIDDRSPSLKMLLESIAIS